MKSLKVGDSAPAFTGIDQYGNALSLKDYKGTKLALYFYPNDSTPTCTVQACNLRDHFDELIDAGINVIGVSPNSSASHLKFSGKNNLPFRLLVDEKLKVIKKYDVWGLKKFMGREFDGVHRTTFLINERQKISGIIDKPKSKMHSQEILDFFKNN